MIQNTHSLLNVPSFSPKSLKSPDSWVGHIPFAAWVMQEVSPNIFVELGTHTGNSYFSFCQSVMESDLLTKCYAIDTWEGDEHAGLYNNGDVFDQVNSHHQEHYANFSKLLRTTFDDAIQYFSNESIDLLHIDGLHTYEAVSHDFESWLPKLAPGALVLFHDTNVRERNFGVWKLWNELQARYPNNIEFLHSHGLGVLQLNNSPENRKLYWLRPNYSEKKQLINFFSAIGSLQLQRLELEEIKHQASDSHKRIAEKDDELIALNKCVANHGEQIEHLTETIAERDEEIKQLIETVSAHNAQITLNNQLIVKSNKLIAHLLSPHSWRITRPFRSVRSAFKHKIGHKDTQTSFSQRFSPDWYLKNNPDVAISKIDPYTHYMLEGLNEGRQPAPDSTMLRGIKRLKRIKVVLTNTLYHNGGIRSLAINTASRIKREGWSDFKQRLILLHARTTNSVAESNGFDRNDYREWILHYDTLTDEIRATMHDRIDKIDIKPVISIVMPTYNPKPEWLIEAIESVRNQIYPYWELCIADDASSDQSIRPILERYAKKDSRIKVTFRERNGHISASSNSALEMVTGEWVALLDHDDLLSEHALFWVADSIHQNPDARIIYSDEDKINEVSRRFAPYFKCDWNLDLFYSQNMLSHLGVYRTGLLKSIGGFREKLEGSQDYDLALRCIEKVKLKDILHIPRVLYHWRVHTESTAHSANAKPYAMIAGEKALNEHFQRQKINARSELIGHGYRVHYTLPETPPMVSLIIPTRNELQLLRQCIESIFEKTTYPNYEILIIDNGSDNPDMLQYLNTLQTRTRVRIVRDERPFNYSALNNAAVELAQGEVLGLLNNDIEVISPEWLSEMVSIALQSQVGAVGARLWFPCETLQHGGIVLGLGASHVAGHSHYQMTKSNQGYFGRSTLISSFSAVSAACMVIQKTIYEEVKGLNEVDLQVAFNDVDFCLRVREKGYRNVWTPYAELHHHESATRGYEDTPEKQARFSKEEQYMKQRWGKQLLSDPAYSPNLTLDHQDFSLAWPPRVSTNYGLKQRD